MEDPRENVGNWTCPYCGTVVPPTWSPERQMYIYNHNTSYCKADSVKGIISGRLAKHNRKWP